MDTFTSIVINYWVCVFIGIGIYGSELIQGDLLSAEWLPYALLVGVIFIIGFTVIANTVSFFGMTFTTIMQKISLIITAIYGIWIFEESSTWSKWTGIILACLAVILLNWKQEKGTPLPTSLKVPWYVWLLPFFTLLINAALDSIFLTMEALQLYQVTDLRLITYFFGFAALLGSVLLIINLWKRKAILSYREIKAGGILGLINYGSIYFVLTSLTQGWEGSTFYTILNICILCLTALLGRMFFSEMLSPMKWLGFALTIIAIILIT